MADGKLERDIERLRKELEKKLAWGQAQEWHSSVFEELSTKVFEATQVMLSVTTLKRFFGVVSHEGNPSITTLDALARFAGAENWLAFRTIRPGRKRLFPSIPQKSIYVTLGFALAVLVIALIGNRRPDVVINPGDFSFSSQPLSREFPNSVIFNFEIPEGIIADSFHIQQYWDPTKTIRIEQSQKQATGIYYYPGYFRAKLMVDGQPALEHDLFMKSDGWLGMVEYEPVPKYFDPIFASSIGVTFPEAIISEVSAREEPVTTAFHFIEDLGNVSGDNFTLETSVKNLFDDRWAVCHSMAIYVLGTSGAMIVPFSKIGCASDNAIMLNDVYLSGKKNDLSPLSADFTSAVALRLKVVDKKMHVEINGREVYNLAYTESMGRFVGLRFKFEGLGEVESLTVYDQSGNEVRL